MAAKGGRPAFEPDGASVRATEVLDRASPAQTSTALARFEFEAGRGNQGTKILMVEWEDNAYTRRTTGQWQVSWDKKKTSTVLPAQDQSRHGVHRLYFLLLPDVTIPPIVTLTHQPSSSLSSSSARKDKEDDSSRTTTMTTVWQINPLPAIFPPELGASARTHGKKGVLHTLWAKKRVIELQREIEAESSKNVEGVALEMAIQERDWIKHNFGIVARPATSGLTISASTDDGSLSPLSPVGPTSPKTPAGSSRLAEKLKGLRVGTSERELSGRQGMDAIRLDDT